MMTTHPTSPNRHPRESGNPFSDTTPLDPRLRGNDKVSQPLRAFAPSREEFLSFGFTRSREDTKKAFTGGGSF